MRRQLVDRIAPPIYGAVDFAVILTPAFSMKIASDHGGMGDTDGLDLIVASTLLGAVHAVIASARLRSEERIAVRRADMWIAAMDALVVLTLAATVLPLAVLWGFADEHASIANHGYPVVALWAGVQLVAVALAEATGRVVFWWLEPHPRASIGFRRHLFALDSFPVASRAGHLPRFGPRWRNGRGRPS
jgi:hypothetical protein